ncbi:MAG TPA: ABC transporter substrate-binding protein [Acidimicrobiales bacterium]
MGRTALLLLAALALIASACSSDSSTEAEGTTETTASSSTSFVEMSGVPGVTDTEIRYSMVGTEANNPAGTCMLSCFQDGVDAYFDYRNDEGGIYGRQLVVSDVLDDEFANNQLKSIEVITNDDTFGTFVASVLPIGYTDLADAGIPVYTFLSDGVLGARDTIFAPAMSSTCTTCTRFDMAYAVKLAEATKVGTLGYDIGQSADCARFAGDSVELYSSELNGAEVAYLNVNLQYGMSNGVAPEVTAMKNAGVDFVFACLDLNGMKTLAQEMERQGMGEVPMYHTNSYDADFMATNATLFEGDYVGTLLRPLESNSEGTALEQFTEWMEKAGAQPTEVAMHGWIAADMAYQGLVAAGAPFTRQSVIDATNGIEDYTAGGMLSPLDFGRQHQPPTQDDPATHGSIPWCFAILQVESGAFTVAAPASDDKPFLCWPGDTRDWSEPEASTFS